MANTAQARKRARQAEATRQRNASLKSSLRTAIKKVRKAIGAGDKAAATKELQAQQSVIDRIADKKVVHKNTASRKVFAETTGPWLARSTAACCGASAATSGLTAVEPGRV